MSAALPSIQLDDILTSLSSSLKANHISDEANDLAQLQAQLNQALYHANLNNSTYQSLQPPQPPNTPTQTTATWNFSDNASNAFQPRPHSKSISRRQHMRPPSFASSIPVEEQNQMMDEAEVEDLLNAQIQIQPAPRLTPYHSSSSSFASTDPFYTSLISGSGSQSNNRDQATGIAPQTAFFGQQQQYSPLVPTHEQR